MGCCYQELKTKVAPTFRGGRGLKRLNLGTPEIENRGSAHLSGWARIETGKVEVMPSLLE